MSDTSALQLMMASVIVVVIGFHFMLKMRHRGTIAVLDVAIWMGAVYFGLGPWIAFTAAGGKLPYVKEDIVVSGYIAIYLYFLALIAVERITQARIHSVQADGTPELLGRMTVMIRDAGRTTTGPILLCYGIVLVLRTILALQYGILFSSSGFENVANLPYGLVIIRLMSEVLSAGCLTWACAAFWLRDPRRRMAILIIVIECLYNFMQGRRAILSCFILLAITYAAVVSRIRFRAVLLSGVGVALLWFVVLPAFFGIRAKVLWGIPKSGNIVVDILNGTTAYYNDNTDVADASYRRNLSTRPLIAGFVFNLLELQDQGAPKMMGDAIGAGIVAATPRVLLFGEKWIYDSELYVLLHYHPYGMALDDTDSSWVAEPVADFGVIGGLVGGLILGSILAIGERVAWTLGRNRPWVALFIVGSMVSIAFQVEQNLEVTWSIARNCIILIIVAVLVTRANPALELRADELPPEDPSLDPLSV
jgi:hypothetical protein